MSRASPTGRHQPAGGGTRPRIKAVAALSGWADLQASLYSHDTPSAQGIALLVAAGLATGRPGAELATINGNVLVGNYQGGGLAAAGSGTAQPGQQP